MHKAELNQLCQRKLWKPPEYSNSRDGPDHDPCFNSIVIVNGVSFQSTNICRTIKAAQNGAAELAFNHFSGSCSGSDSNESSSALHPLPSGNVMQRPLTPVGVKDNKNSLAGQHLYKNRLQEYAQKGNIGFPVYSFERQGPPHSSQFKCKVTVGGQTYEDTIFYSTLKEAENAAAKIALEQVSPNENQEDKSSLYKNLLQELAQKRGFFIPSYETEGTGPFHIPVFVSTVKVNDKVYQGLSATSKKMAEMSAAKCAYDSLKDGPLHLKEQHQQNGCTKDNLQCGPLHLNEQHQQKVCTKENLQMGPLHSYEKHQQNGFTKENLQMGPLNSYEKHQQNGFTKENLQMGPLNSYEKHQQNGFTKENLQMGPLHSYEKHQQNGFTKENLQMGPLHSYEKHQQIGFTKENLQMGPLHLNEQHQQNGSTKENLQMAIKAMKCETQSKEEAVLSEPTTKTAENGFSYPSPMSYQQTAVTDGKRPRTPTSCDNVPRAGEAMTADNKPLHMIFVYPRSKMPNLRENNTTISMPYVHDKWVALKMEYKSQI